VRREEGPSLGAAQYDASRVGCGKQEGQRHIAHPSDPSIAVSLQYQHTGVWIGAPLYVAHALGFVQEGIGDFDGIWTPRPRREPFQRCPCFGRRTASRVGVGRGWPVCYPDGR